MDDFDKLELPQIFKNVNMKDIEQNGKKEMASSNILIFLVWISFVLHTGSMAYAGKCYSLLFC